MIQAVSHIATLLTELMKRSTETLADSLKYYEDESLREKAKTKQAIIELAV